MLQDLVTPKWFWHKSLGGGETGRGGGERIPFSIHCKKRISFFPSPAGMSLTKLSLVGNNLILPGQEDFGQLNPSRGREKPFFTV
jgi:hypothetical protein